MALLVWRGFDDPFRDAKFAFLGVATGLLVIVSRIDLAGVETRVRATFWAALAALALSTVMAFQRGLAVQALVEQLSLMLLLPLGAAIASSRDAHRRLLSLLVDLTVVVSVIACLQERGFDPLRLINRFPYPTSTIGFKNYVGEVLALGALAALAAFLEDGPRSSLRRRFAALAFFLASYGLWLVRARSSAVGLAVGIMAFVALAPSTLRIVGRSWRLLIAGAAVVACVALIPVLADLPGMTPTAGSIDREKRAPLDTSTLDARFVRWRNTATLIAEHSVFGVGLGNFRVFYPQVGASDPEQSERSLVWEAHNEVLHLWAETGILGLAALVGLVVCILSELVRRSRRHDGERLPAVAVAMTLMLIIQGLTCYRLRNPVSSAWLWLVLGAALSAGPDPADIRLGGESTLRRLSVGGLHILDLSTAVRWPVRVLLAAAVIGSSVSTAWISAVTRDGTFWLVKHRPDRAIAEYASVSGLVGADKARVRLCSAQAQALRPREAIVDCSRALASEPNDPQLHYQLAMAFLAVGDETGAIDHLEQTVALLPRFNAAAQTLARLRGARIESP